MRVSAVSFTSGSFKNGLLFLVSIDIPFHAVDECDNASTCFTVPCIDGTQHFI